ncbi:MAG: hypothetical protein GX319_02585 [Clostridiales bacterium]|nr:hypothetical protein [Clostridiales bacterium]
MKTKNSDIAVKIFLVVVAVILVGLLIAWSTGVFKDKRNDLNEGTERINNVLGSMAEFDLLVYDSASISGDTLVKLIADVKNRELELSIGVNTLANPSVSSTRYYNRSMKNETSGNVLGSEVTLNPTTDKTDDDYINPTGKFKGEIKRDVNDNIIGLVFVQHR